MSISFHINQKWVELFQQHGLYSFDAFFKNEKSFELVSAEKCTYVYKLSLNGSNFYLKRILPEHFKKIIRSLLKGKGFWNPVENELNNISHLQKNHLPVMNIAAWGIKKILGFPISSFIVSEEVPGEEFMDLYDRSDSKVRKLLYHEYGKLMAFAHNTQLDTTIRPQDIYCDLSKDQESIKLTLIDREEGSTKRIVYSKKNILRVLSVIFYKFIKKNERLCISSKDIISFIEAYLKYSNIIKVTKKDFYRQLEGELFSYMSKRKSQQFVIDLLPESIAKRNKRSQ